MLSRTRCTEGSNNPTRSNTSRRNARLAPTRQLGRLALTAVASMGFNFGVMLFILNGLGYLGLLAVLQLPIRQLARFRSAARWALIAFAALTIVLFFLMAPTYTILGYVDKAIEVALIALLLADAYAASSKPSG